MALSLGEKLRQAREERGISISEVAEQTRISPLYIESIENDDYKTLPGGIFNKGFVRSYAKFIGFDEQEALSDYSQLAAENEILSEQPLKVHRSEVLTDDNSTRSMLPTLIFAVVILGLMTAGVLFLLNYLQSPGPEVAANKNANSNPPGNTANNAAVATPTPMPGTAPTMATLKVDFQAASDPISLLAVSDGVSTNPMVQGGGGIVSFEPKEALRLTYSKSLASSARLFMNGKPIVLPEGPLNPRRNTIEFEINKDNVTRIWEEGRIVPVLPAAPANTNVAVQTPTPTATPAVTPTTVPTRPAATPRPTPAVTPPPVNRPPVNRPRPTPTVPPARTPVPRPTPN
jgi:transcriptional regulator with XRE-family HTH domain